MSHSSKQSLTNYKVLSKEHGSVVLHNYVFSRKFEVIFLRLSLDEVNYNMHSYRYSGSGNTFLLEAKK